MAQFPHGGGHHEGASVGRHHCSSRWKLSRDKVACIPHSNRWSSAPDRLSVIQPIRRFSDEAAASLTPRRQLTEKVLLHAIVILATSPAWTAAPGWDFRCAVGEDRATHVHIRLPWPCRRVSMLVWIRRTVAGRCGVVAHHGARQLHPPASRVPSTASPASPTDHLSALGAISAGASV